MLTIPIEVSARHVLVSPKHADILFATSITDYIFRYLAFAFLLADDLADLGIALASNTVEGPSARIEEKAVPKLTSAREEHRESITRTAIFADTLCRLCGGILIRTGTCKTCTQCGTSDGGC